MSTVQVTLSKFIDESFPGWVECWLEDVHGRRWKFNEKAPVVSDKDLWTDSEYPQTGEIACTVLQRIADASHRYVVTIDTAGTESIEGCTVFDVLAEQVIGDVAVKLIPNLSPLADLLLSCFPQNILVFFADN
jgi:hypothetical protein